MSNDELHCKKNSSKGENPARMAQEDEFNKLEDARKLAA